MAISIEFGETVGHGASRYQVLITEAEDNFSHSDLDGLSDDRMYGFLACLYITNDEGDNGIFDDGDPVEMFHTKFDDVLSPVAWAEALEDGEDLRGTRLFDAPSEIEALCDTVTWYIRKVENGEGFGRSHVGNW